ncbi:MAG TPA: nuclear transport factor 2 family protein [Pyrinomonadaceae bacterium]|nr:nuclear transport factor 2 family protein [Pyrinomonadaceae bacterium]
MKNPSPDFIPLRPNKFSLRAMLLLTTLLLTPWANAQSNNRPDASRELYAKIASLDSSLFEAFNRCDLDKVGAFFIADLEFYHEKGGLTKTRKSVIDVMRNNLCGENSNRVRRELVQGSLEVTPINNYGAIETGEHRFYLTVKGQNEKLDGIGKFVHLWQKEGSEWRISRVISYGFRPPESLPQK